MNMWTFTLCGSEDWITKTLVINKWQLALDLSYTGRTNIFQGSLTSLPISPVSIVQQTCSQAKILFLSMLSGQFQLCWSHTHGTYLFCKTTLWKKDDNEVFYTCSLWCSTLMTFMFIMVTLLLSQPNTHLKDKENLSFYFFAWNSWIFFPIKLI